MAQDPSYLANLKALPTVERERLLFGNWKIKPAAGLYFNRNQIGEMLPFVPADVKTFVRAWDLAATSETEGGEPAYTSGVLMGKRANGRYIVIDVINVRQSAAEVRATLRMTAAVDNAKYGHVRIRIPQDPGQAGKDQAQSLVKHLAGYSVKVATETGSKEVRAEPVAAQWQAGNIDVLIADWNEMYFSQLESFPESKFMDMVDATSTAFTYIERVFSFESLIYASFDEEIHTYEELPEVFVNEVRRFISVDYGITNPMCYLEILDDGINARVESEFYYSPREHGKQKTDVELAEDFVKFAGKPDDVMWVVLDEKAVTFRTELRNRGYRVKNADPDERNGISKVVTMFSHDKLLINQKCRYLINELHGYVWDDTARENGKEEPVKTNDNACDALRNAIATVVYTKRRFMQGR
jgi:predicted phage terminase large subunit-like protein